MGKHVPTGGGINTMTERRLALWTAIALVMGLTLMPVAAGAAQQRAEPALLTLGW